MPWKPRIPPTPASPEAPRARPVSQADPLDGGAAPRAPWAQRELWAERDRQGARWLHRAAASPAVVLMLVLVSRLGDGMLWYSVMVLLPFLGGPGGWTCAFQMALVGAINLLIYLTLKRCIARERPFMSCPDIRACARALDQFSFPSGHTLHAVAFSMVLAGTYPVLAPLLWTFTALVALSRVVLGLHYPSDVLAGAGIGALIAALALSLI